MSEKNVLKVVTGPKCRMSYANVWEAKAMQGQEAKFSVAILVPKSDKVTVQKIKDAIAAARAQGKEKFGKGWDTNALGLPLHDGDEEKPDDPAYAGHFYFNASSKSRPQIVDADINPIMDQDEFYSGCYARASVNFYAYNNVKKGVGVGLNNLMKTADGERLGGGSTAAEDFGQFDDDLD